jgi:hypothetical protein
LPKSLTSGRISAQIFAIKYFVLISIKNEQSREIYNIGYTRQKTQSNRQKPNIICVGHHYTQQTQIMEIQTTGGKDENSEIVTDITPLNYEQVEEVPHANR